MTQQTRHGDPLTPLWRVLPVVIVASLGIGLVIAGMFIGVLLVSVGGLMVVVQGGALWLRDRLPRCTLMVTTALDLGILSLSSGEVSVGPIGVFIAAYSLRRHASARTAYLWLAVAAILSTVVHGIVLSASNVVPGEWTILLSVVRAVLVFGLPLLIAEIADSRSRLLSALRERAELADREKERLAVEAVQQERALIARELHDIAAHHMSGIIVGAQAAGALISSDPEQAREYIRRIGRDAQLTLANLRQTVGLLRVQGEGERAPLPAIAQIADLVEDLRARGRRITLHQSGDPVPLGPVAEVAAYRMVQESLANAASHAPGAECDVAIRYTTDGAQLSVVNAASPALGIATLGSGYGIIGMEERAALVHGRLQYGPTPDGGWRNDLFIPAAVASAAVDIVDRAQGEGDGEP